MVKSPSTRDTKRCGKSERSPRPQAFWDESKGTAILFRSPLAKPHIEIYPMKIMKIIKARAQRVSVNFLFLMKEFEASIFQLFIILSKL